MIFSQEPEEKSSKMKSQFQQIEFDCDSTLQRQILESQLRYHKHAHEFQVKICDWQDFGIDYIKKFVKVSPDGFMQMAFQLAYYRMFKRFDATYESAQTKRFFCGRTETGRVVSSESRSWTEAMDDTSVALPTKIALFQAACDAHIRYLKRAGNAQGCDRHLLGLKSIAQDHGLPEHPLFSDIGFQKSFHHNLSTSQLSSPNFFVSFGPVVEDGFGICYCLRRNALIASISARATCAQTDVHEFEAQLRKAFSDLKKLTPTPKSNL